MNTREGYSIDPRYERSAPIMDRGCPYPFHNNPYAGVEPAYYDEQGFPYWEPLPEDEDHE